MRLAGYGVAHPLAADETGSTLCGALPRRRAVRTNHCRRNVSSPASIVWAARRSRWSQTRCELGSNGAAKVT
jgi:hypothetical protein